MGQDSIFLRAKRILKFYSISPMPTTNTSIATLTPPRHGLTLEGRTDGAVFKKAGYKTMELGTTGTVKTVYYHHPLDNTDALTPEIMEDATKLLYLGLLNLSNDKSIEVK